MSNETYRQFDPWRPAPVRETERKDVYETHYFNIDRVSFESNDGNTFERYCIHANSGDTIAVLALTDDGKIPLVEQYRVATHRWTLEIPGGHALGDERPLDTAKRKLAEEGGFEAERYTQFARFLNTPSYSTEHTSIYFATKLTPASRQSIGPETPRSEVRLVTLDQAYEMVVNGTIVDAKTIVAILRLKSGDFEHIND